MKKASKRTATKCNDHVIVRTRSAGVHFGQLVWRKGLECELKNARRIWYWKGANTLHEVALHGVSAGSKVSVTVANITLTEGVEFIPCHVDAVKSLRNAQWGA